MRLSKKDRAFDLFSQGYLPSSPEIKELNLRGNTRYTYFDIWKRQGPSVGSSAPQLSGQTKKPASKSTPLPGGESVSAMDESKLAKKPDVAAKQPPVEVDPISIDDELNEEPEDIEQDQGEVEVSEQENEEPQEESEEGEGEVEGNQQQSEEREQPTKEKESEPKPGIKPVDLRKRSKDGKKEIPTDIIGQGIWVTVNLSIKTYALYQIAANMAEEELELGDFLDTAAEDMYRVRGKDLGLVTIRRKK